MKKSKAQQLIEFALTLPIFIVLLLTLVEIGMAVNAKLSLSEASKMAVIKSSEFQDYIGTTDENKQTYFESKLITYLQTYMKDHNIPNYDTVNVTLESINDNTSLAVVSYTYVPTFKLPNIFGGHVIPDSITFTTYQMVNNIYLKISNFNGSEPTQKTTTTSALYENHKVDTIDIMPMTVFLVGVGSEDYKYAKLVNWYGQDLLPVNAFLNIQTNTLCVKRGTNTWTDTGVGIPNLLSNLYATTGIYTQNKDNKAQLTAWTDNYDFSTLPLDNSLGVKWCGSASVACTADFSGSIDNLLKRGLSMLLTTTGTANGTLDNTTGYTNLDTEKIKLFTNANYNVKLYLPSSVTSGTFTPSPVYSYYLDTDGDKVPDASDEQPLYFDFDGNGTFDGDQTSVGANPLDSSYNTVTVGTQYYSGYRIEITADDYGTITRALPKNLDNTSVAATKNYTPTLQTITVKKVTIKRVTTTGMGNATIASGALYYVKSGNILTRKLTALTSTEIDGHFIYGTTSAISKSFEKSTIESNLFETKLNP